jgi:hypothetical protein
MCYPSDMHKKIADVHLDGFVVTSAAPGEMAQVQVKDWATSESPLFYVYAEQIANLIFPKLGVFKDRIDHYLMVLHPDDTADVFLQTFPAVVQTRVNRTIQAGEPIMVADLTDIEDVRFPEAAMNPGDRVVYFTRRAWRFGIFFDLTRQATADLLAKDAAQLQKKLLFEDILQATIAELREAEKTGEAFVITEGKTDWRHIDKAFTKIGYLRKLRYETSDKDRGDAELLEICEHLSLTPHGKPVICIFDGDSESIRKELAKRGSEAEPGYQRWGNNVFSLMLPVPDHRKDYKYLSIEMYYADEVLDRCTSEGKRLCFDNELKTEVLPGKNIKTVLIPPDSSQELSKKIASKDIDRIEDSAGRRVGLSKAAFAELVRTETAPFRAVDFASFGMIADVVEKILTRRPS